MYVFETIILLFFIIFLPLLVCHSIRHFPLFSLFIFSFPPFSLFSFRFSPIFLQFYVLLLLFFFSHFHHLFWNFCFVVFFSLFGWIPFLCYSNFLVFKPQNSKNKVLFLNFCWTFGVDFFFPIFRIKKRNQRNSPVISLYFTVKNFPVPLIFPFSFPSSTKTQCFLFLLWWKKNWDDCWYTKRRICRFFYLMIGRFDLFGCCCCFFSFHSSISTINGSDESNGIEGTSLKGNSWCSPIKRTPQWTE